MAIVNSTIDTLKKTYAKRHDRQSLLRHLATKRSGSILSTPKPAQGRSVKRKTKVEVVVVVLAVVVVVVVLIVVVVVVIVVVVVHIQTLYQTLQYFSPHLNVPKT